MSKLRTESIDRPRGPCRVAAPIVCAALGLPFFRAGLTLQGDRR